MSAKWVRSQQWDDQFFPAWAWPAKFVLRAFSSIWLAVLLLSGVACFGVLASVPIGMLAAIPTWLLYLGVCASMLTVGAAIPTFAVVRLARVLQFAPALRFVFGFAALLGGAALGWFVFAGWAWPALHYDPVKGTGIRFFGEFSDHYRGTVLRRLPGLEMSELEFYGWWPIKVLLLLFVANMTIATLRRIEFNIYKAGVITIHSGIVIIAIGSVYYSSLKQEGDMLLLAGELDEKTGRPSEGPPQQGFYDNTAVSLWVARTDGERAARPDWEQRPLDGLPRYNNYALDAVAPTIAGGERSAADEGRTLSVPAVSFSKREIVDADIAFRVVGYSNYAQTRETWVDAAAAGPGAGVPVRHIELISNLPALEKGPSPATPSGPTKVGDFVLAPGWPADRVASLQEFLSVEYLEGATPAYWEALQTKFPEKTQHGLVVEIPGSGLKQVLPVEQGQTIEVGGWSLTVKELHPRPPLSVVTPGYEGAMSSVAIVRVVPPAAPGGAAPVAFDRYIYQRFPELNQDLLEERSASGMPRRRPSDDSIRIGYIDRSRVLLVIDAGPDGRGVQGAGAAGAVGAARALVCLPGRDAILIDDLKEGVDVPIGPMVSARMGKRYASAEKIDAPWPVKERDQQRDMIGNHKAAQIAVEVSTIARNGAKNGERTWSTVVWVPHNAYHPVQEREDAAKAVPLPDGRQVTIAFGRRYHRFPNFLVTLRDFEMTPYPHSTQPQDFKSDVTIIRDPFGPGRSEDRQSTSLNNPLLVRASFQPNPEVNRVVNSAAWLVSWIAPTQFKLSQTGWDAGGWNQTKAAADRGELPKPFARFTILGVGNNPGIYVIAAGAIMISIGIPYAFYVKPWLLQREKRRLQRLVAEGKFPVRPGAGRNGANGTITRAGMSLERAGQANEVVVKDVAFKADAKVGGAERPS